MPAVKLDEGEESVTEVGSRTAQLPSREEVIQALHACYDPCCRDRKISVVDMGLIEGIEMRGSDVGITLVLTTGWCPFSAQLFAMIQSKVGALAGVETVDVEAVWKPAWTPERMSEEARSKLRLPLETLRPLREARLKGDAP
jgi:metal-sulfur cluster biosynthetic enzyme